MNIVESHEQARLILESRLRVAELLGISRDDAEVLSVNHVYAETGVDFRRLVAVKKNLELNQSEIPLYQIPDPPNKEAYVD